jgi:hypothetical protein
MRCDPDGVTPSHAARRNVHEPHLRANNYPDLSRDCRLGRSGAWVHGLDETRRAGAQMRDPGPVGCGGHHLGLTEMASAVVRGG